MIGIIKKFNLLLNGQQKIRAVILLFLMVIGAVLETLSVSLIFPLVSAVLEPDIIEKNKYVREICRIFDLHSTVTFIILVIFFLIFMFIVKNLFLYFEYYVQFRFVFNNRFEAQKRLMGTYLKRPYEFFLHASTGEIMRVVGGDVTNAFSLLTTVLSFFTEAIISGMLVLMLFAVDPLMTLLIAAILGITQLMIARVVKPVLRKAGLEQQKNSALSNKWLLQAVTGIKEIKVAGKEDFFINQFSKYGKRGILAERKNSLLGNVPRLLIETVSIGGMLGVIAILLFQGQELTSMIPQLSAFAGAAVRLMPSANRLSAAYNTMSYQEPSLDKLLENLRAVDTWEKERENQKFPGQHKEKASGTQTVSIKKSIELSHVTYSYPGTEKKILSDVTLKIAAGTTVGIVGTSGAGKTTAVDALLGLLEPSEGNVLSDGVNIKDDYHGWLSKIGYIPQMIFMLDDSIRANVAFGFGGEEISDEKVWKALREASLEEFVKELPEGLDTEIGERGVRLSGGQRQRIGIARALYTEPDLLIFDEATSALDNETEAAIMDSINLLHGTKTMIIIAHRLQTIEGCDSVYRVVEGKIVKER